MPCLASFNQTLWKERSGIYYWFPWRRFWKHRSWLAWMLCLHPCLPCWTQPKTCAPASLCWFPMGCIYHLHLFIALSLPPTHRYTEWEINLYQRLHINTIIKCCWWCASDSQDPIGTTGQFAEVESRHKVSGVLQRLLLLLRSARCCHPAAQWYITHLRRARHLLHKVIYRDEGFLSGLIESVCGSLGWFQSSWNKEVIC